MMSCDMLNFCFRVHQDSPSSSPPPSLSPTSLLSLSWPNLFLFRYLSISFSSFLSEGGFLGVFMPDNHCSHLIHSSSSSLSPGMLLI
ncbi:hypothetical protein Agabi119p4_2436 [Agaricus bisporus var. burnettii]|uniref:Uncharacterized protein n=1 Tax=Agaricus bisporus var. burnettii TaxID=192524 RepID=A0A8H7KKD0_AGABI|nr:hypothetical protein Agabi119p4_2436 [Agaricus bisporus var. burnettii]